MVAPMLRGTPHITVFNIGQESLNRSILRLPFNLIALIISLLDAPSDLSRLCRTSRLFHYMTVPQLYSSVTLHSYDHIRYSPDDGRPEGCGMASPFSMGLNGFVCRNVAGYVKRFGLIGEWKEQDLEEYAKAGRVPDESMILNSLVGASIARMSALEEFSWDLNTKMLPTIWQCLAQSSVRKITVRFPTTRHARPIATVPPMPNLVSLKIYDIDPLCYADDISLLLLSSNKLHDLKLIWSPRMREMCEPSININSMFGRVIAAQSPLNLRSLAIKNLFMRNDGTCGNLMKASLLEEVTVINSPRGSESSLGSVFVDGSARIKPSPPIAHLRSLRTDRVSKEQCDFLVTLTGLQKIFLVSPPREQPPTPLPTSPPSSNAPSPPSALHFNLKDPYLEAITTNHGSTLTHLLLPPTWRLPASDIARLVRNCPNLQQLAVGIELPEFPHMKLLIPFLPKLRAFRILDNPEDGGKFSAKMRELDEARCHEKEIAEGSAEKSCDSMRWVGISESVFEVGKAEQAEGRWRRKVWRRTLKDVEDVAIWKMDSLEV